MLVGFLKISCTKQFDEFYDRKFFVYLPRPGDREEPAR